MDSRFKSSLSVISIIIACFIGFACDNPDVSGELSNRTSEFTPHSTILITRNDDFTSENGVTSGNGTKLEPFIIGDWEINSSYGDGIEIRDTTAFFIIHNVYIHSISGNYYGMSLINVANGKIEKNEIMNNNYGINLENTTDITIVNNNIKENIYGIFFKESSYINFNNNKLRANLIIGINLVDSTNNEIIENEVISNHQRGISLEFSSNNNIVDNIVSLNNWDGIYIEQSTSNKIISNNITSNGKGGIYLFSSKSNIIEENRVVSNGNQGINLGVSSDSNVIITNNVSLNYYGVYIVTSKGNKIYHNNFINNTFQVYIESGSNIWNDIYPSVGNFWNEYTAKDQFQGKNQNEFGSDGIFDIPYIIDTDNIDNYPLTNPYSIPILSSPQNFCASIGIFFIKLEWDEPIFKGRSPIISYILYKGTKSEEKQLYKDLGIVYSYNDTTVSNGIIYYYKLSAVNSEGEGLLSNEVRAIPGSVPTAPIKLSANSGDSFINVSWRPPVFNGGLPITNYRIVKSIPPDDAEVIINVGNTLFFNDTSVTNNIIYRYRISAINSIGISSTFIEMSVIPFKHINKPPSVTIKANNNYGATPLIVLFTGLGTDPDGIIVSYKWDFDDGEISLEENPVHTFASLGTYLVELTVIDNNGTTNSSTILITVISSIPVSDNMESTVSEEKKDDNDEFALWFLAGGITLTIGIFIFALFFITLQMSIAAKKVRGHKEVRKIKEYVKKKKRLKGETILEPGPSVEAPLQAPEDEQKQKSTEVSFEPSPETGMESMDQSEFITPEALIEPQIRDVPTIESPEEIIKALNQKYEKGEISKSSYKKLLKKYQRKIKIVQKYKK
jgi:parallel beta-helix repeat protein